MVWNLTQYTIIFLLETLHPLAYADYISNRRLLLSIADAGGRLMYAYKDLLELAGLTTRVYTLISTLHALPPVREFEVSPQIVMDNVGICIPRRKVGNDVSEVPDGGENKDGHRMGLGEGEGPESLMEPLKLVIKRGEHLMITGPVCSSVLLHHCIGLRGLLFPLNPFHFAT
jgi:ATP-binding cassette subfamily D (ALD) long-chain fatty acid import protein